MKENADEKLLVRVNEYSIFYKIKRFFKNLFIKQNSVNNSIGEKVADTKQNKDKRNQFMEQIRKIEDEEIILLKLQKRYRNGEIKVKDLTDEQVRSLCRLYDKQISNLKKSNKIRKQKLLGNKK